MPNPGETPCEPLLVHVERRRLGQAEDDLRLDTRLGDTSEPGGGVSFKIAHGARIEIAPHRRIGPKPRPGVTIGDTDLATDWPLAARRPQVANRPGDSVGVGDLECGIAGSNRRDLASC